MSEFEDINAVVTGGGSGIGEHIAVGLAERGARVWITGRTASKLDAVAARHEGIVPFVCDVTDDAAIVALRDAVDAAGGCDLLVNNAGVFHLVDVVEGGPLERQLSEIDIDVTGPVRMVHHFMAGLLQRRSTVVNVSSALAFVPYAAAPVYSGAKAFVHAWTQSLRAQLAGTSVRVVELMPPVVDTPMVAGLDASLSRMPPEDLTRAFFAGLRRGDEEITPGQARQLKWARRIAPGFIFRQLNAQPRPTAAADA